MRTHPKVNSELLLQILEDAPIAVWAASGEDHDYAIRLWNSGAERLYGYSRDDALGRNYLDLFVNELEREQAIADHRRTVRDRKPYRNLARDVMADGSERLILTQGFPLWDPRANEYLQAELGTDVTEISGEDVEWLSNVRAMATKAKLIEPLTTVAEWITSLGHSSGGLSGLIPLICDTVRTLTDESARCRVWRSGADWSPSLLLGSDEEIVAGEYDELELVEWVQSSRKRVVVDYDANHPPISADGRRRRKRFPVKSVRPQSRTPFVALPLSFGEDPIGVLVIYQEPGFKFDPLLRQVLEQFAKHVALGISTAEMIGGLQNWTEIIAESEAKVTRDRLVEDFSHQMRKVAGPIKLSTELLRERLRSLDIDDNALVAIKEIEARADELMEGIRNLATDLEPTVFDLDALVLGIARALRAQYPDLDIEYSNRLGLPVYLEAVRPFLVAAIRNVVDNGIEAMESSGVLGIELDADPEGGIQLRVNDSGSGIDVAQQERVWEREVSTKVSGQGYGLWRTRQVIEQLGGKALIGSSDADGTTIVLRLPHATYDEPSLVGALDRSAHRA